MDPIKTFSTFTPAITAALLLLLFCLVLFTLYFRGARYVLLDRIWRLVHKTDFYDAGLRRHHERQLDLERFEFMNGLNSVGSLSAAYAAKSWADEIGLSLRTMGKAGRWVDWKTRQVKKPGTYGTIRRGFLVFVAITAAYGLILFAGSSDMFAQFKESNTVAWVANDHARAFTPLLQKPWTITKANCDEGTVQSLDVPLSPTEVKYVCDSLGTEEFASLIEENVLIQRLAAGLLLLTAIGAMWFLFKRVVTRMNAGDVWRHIEKHKKNSA